MSSRGMLTFVRVSVKAVIRNKKFNLFLMFPDACKSQTLHQEIPLEDTNKDESFENEDDTTLEPKQAVIKVDKEENAEYVQDLLGDGHMSEASSVQSISELSKEASGDANRAEPDYVSSEFCVQDQSGRRHARLIMLRMDNTEHFEELNDAGLESERAASSSEEPHERPGLTRVTLHRESGGRQNQLFLQQESPPGRLEETSAVQPSMEDTTQKYYISAQSSGEPYMTERLNYLQQPANQQRPLPNGVERYHHVNVNAMYAGANYEHFDQTSTSDNNDPMAT